MLDDVERCSTELLCNVSSEEQEKIGDTVRTLQIKFHHLHDEAEARTQRFSDLADSLKKYMCLEQGIADWTKQAQIVVNASIEYHSLSELQQQHKICVVFIYLNIYF